MRSKPESPPLGPIRTIALYREGVAGGEGGERGVGGCRRETQREREGKTVEL